MVKADPKQDYYADLELTSSATEEDVKRKFRLLAKQYHPDRNPGREIDVVPKFQAIQAAHEVLGDAEKRRKYDQARAEYLATHRSTELPTFKKPPPPPPRTGSTFADGNTTSSFRQDPAADRFPSQNGSWRPQSASADKFAQFARQSPQRDKSRFQDNVRADAARGFGAMKGAPPTSPLRTRPHPTARVPPVNSFVRDASSFPNLARTDSDPPGSTNTAYAHYKSGKEQRPPSAGSTVHTARDDIRSKHGGSPLRQTRSSHFEGFYGDVRPGLSRASTRYAHAGTGERTAVHTPDLSRSASLRNSPTEAQRDHLSPETPADQHMHQARRRSLSPRTSPDTIRKGRSAHRPSSTSSDDSEELPSMRTRPTVTPRSRANYSKRTFTQADDAFEKQYPSTNYTRVVNEDSQYQYPPPESRGPIRRPFADLPDHLTHDHSHPDDATAWNPAENSADSTRQSNGNSDKMQDGFFANVWHETFEINPNAFTPREPATHGRKSPTKNNRTTRSVHERNFTGTKDSVQASQDTTTFVVPEPKATAFQTGRLPADFAERVKTPHVDSSGMLEGDGTTTNGLRMPDVMDVDTPDTQEVSPGIHPSKDPEQVVVEEDISSEGYKSEPSHASDSLNMKDLKHQAPFAPNREGLKDMNDLSTTLPFNSRVQPLQDPDRVRSSTIRDLQLPKAPKAPLPPADDELTQHVWKTYAESMAVYMQSWNAFNTAMLKHFESRQTSVTHHMFRNWITALGDGASAEDFEASHGGDLAGYGTYMTWLEDDRKCRLWWDMAFEEHRMCLQNLGRVRNKVKEMCSR